jgi:hypothetical protein
MGWIVYYLANKRGRTDNPGLAAIAAPNKK